MPEQPKLVVKDDPPATDKLLALLWWWLPFFVFIPILSKRSSNYVREHLMAVRCTFITLFAFLFLVPLARSFMLFSQTGDALGSFAEAIPSIDAILNDFFASFGIAESSTDGAGLPISLTLLWCGAALFNTLAISRGRFPYFLAPTSLEPIVKAVGVGALVTAWLAGTVHFAVAGEVGPAIDAVDYSTVTTFILCMVGGFLLLRRTLPVSEMMLLFGSTLVSAGLLITIMRIDLDPFFPFRLGVVILSIGLLTLLFSRWRTYRKASANTDEKPA